MFLKKLTDNSPKKKIAVLLDPAKETEESAYQKAMLSAEAGVDFLFAGGSLGGGETDELVTVLKSACRIPVVLFPGNILQITGRADALLMLSLISGRNADFLIGQHVTAAHVIKKSGLDVVPVGYMLIDGGRISSAEYISGTRPIPADKPDIAAATAMAGEMLGMRAIYLEAGSGAHKPVSLRMISEVRKNIAIPIIVGGGLRSEQYAADACAAGADLIVVGNLFEDEHKRIRDFADAVHGVS